MGDHDENGRIKERLTQVLLEKRLCCPVNNASLRFYVETLAHSSFPHQKSREHDDIKNSKIGFPVLGNPVLLRESRNDRIVTLRLSVAAMATFLWVHFERDMAIIRKLDKKSTPSLYFIHDISTQFGNLTH